MSIAESPTIGRIRALSPIRVSERRLWILVTLLALGDALTTGYAIHFELAPEANPIIVAAIEMYGIAGIFLFKTIYIAALYGIASAILAPYHLAGVAIGFLGGGLILLNNTVVLLQAHGFL